MLIFCMIFLINFFLRAIIWWRIKIWYKIADTSFKDILPWNISQMITKAVPISTRIVISYAMKQETETTTWWEFPNGGKTIVEQILASEERNKGLFIWGELARLRGLAWPVLQIVTGHWPLPTIWVSQSVKIDADFLKWPGIMCKCIFG